MIPKQPQPNPASHAISGTTNISHRGGSPKNIATIIGTQPYTPARVAIQHRGAYDLLGETGELRASAANRLVREENLPAVGDWVGLDLTTNLIEAVLRHYTGEECYRLVTALSAFERLQRGCLTLGITESPESAWLDNQS